VYARFDNQDLSLWEIFAFHYDIDADFIRTSNKHRKKLFHGVAKRRLKELLEALHAIKSSTGRDPSLILLWVNSGGIYRLVPRLRNCSTSVSMREKYEVAEAAIETVAEFVKYGNDVVRTRLVEVPNLLSSLVSLCGEEVLLRFSQPLVENIGRIAYNLSISNPIRAVALMEAGWANLLVRALRARLHNEDAAYYVTWAIHTLLSDGPLICKILFIAAGAKSTLKKTLKRHPTDNEVKRHCTHSLRILGDR